MGQEGTKYNFTGEDAFAVQPAEREHMAQVAGLYVRSWRATYEGLIIQSYLDGLCAEKKQADWEEHIEKPDHGMYIAVSGGRVLGFAAFRPFERMENTVYIDSLHVDGQAKKRGIGTALIEAVKAYGREKGYAHMALQVVQGNDNAHNFYLARGGEHRSSRVSTFTGVETISEVFVWDL